MKVEVTKGFRPIAITLTTAGEAAIMKGLIGDTNETERIRVGKEYSYSAVAITREDADAFFDLYQQLDELV